MAHLCRRKELIRGFSIKRGQCMIQSSGNKEISQGKKRVLISVYLGFMLIFYLGYILLDNFRLNKSEQWINANNLTQGDIQNIEQLGFWTSMFEVAFLGLLLLATLLLFRYRKNRKTIVHFLILHLCLFTTVFLIGYILSFFLIAPIGNLTQPLISSTFLLVLIVIFTAFVLMKERLSKRI